MRRARAAKDMAGDPATSEDLAHYGVRSRSGPGKPGVFDQE
jgi:hypothetical protein